MKKHHKVLIGSFSSLLIAVLVLNSVFIYVLYGSLEMRFSDLSSDIETLRQETQSNVNALSENLIEVKGDLEKTADTLDLKVSSVNEELESLKISSDSSFSGIIEDAVKAVVTIKTDVSQGTGFIISSDGYLVTNAHVLEGASRVVAYDYNKNSMTAEFIGYVDSLDIALLKISGNFEELELEDSDDVSVGERVIAIGNPLGLEFSVSEGIVSGVHREGLVSGLNAYIQTDAALNPGNSGGPLINKQGKVIGINNFKLSDGESLGFALESNYIKEAVNMISKQELGMDIF